MDWTELCVTVAAADTDRAAAIAAMAAPHGLYIEDYRDLEEGARQIEETIAYYRRNARVIKEGLEAAGFTVYGAVNSPYIWCKTPEGVGSWEFFDQLLERANIITTPGAGFGPSGEGYVRLTAFGDADATVEAMERIKRLMA